MLEQAMARLWDLLAFLSPFVFSFVAFIWFIAIAENELKKEELKKRSCENNDQTKSSQEKKHHPQGT